jgi:hypothetical protein
MMASIVNAYAAIRDLRCRTNAIPASTTKAAIISDAGSGVPVQRETER